MERQQVEPRVWLALAVGAILLSFVPFWMFIGIAGLLLNVLLVVGAAAALWLNYRGEKRRQELEDA